MDNKKQYKAVNRTIHFIKRNVSNNGIVERSKTIHQNTYFFFLIFHSKESDGDVGCRWQTWSGYSSEQTTSA